MRGEIVTSVLASKACTVGPLGERTWPRLPHITPTLTCASLRPVSEPEEPGAEMAWFWVTEHDSTEGSWQLRIVRDGIVPATPLATAPSTEPVSEQSQEAAADQPAYDMKPTVSHDEL